MDRETSASEAADVAGHVVLVPPGDGAPVWVFLDGRSVLVVHGPTDPYTRPEVDSITVDGAIRLRQYRTDQPYLYTGEPVVVRGQPGHKFRGGWDGHGDGNLSEVSASNDPDAPPPPDEVCFMAWAAPEGDGWISYFLIAPTGHCDGGVVEAYTESLVEVRP